MLVEILCDNLVRTELSIEKIVSFDNLAILMLLVQKMPDLRPSLSETDKKVLWQDTAGFVQDYEKICKVCLRLATAFKASPAKGAYDAAARSALAEFDDSMAYYGQFRPPPPEPEP